MTATVTSATITTGILTSAAFDPLSCGGERYVDEFVVVEAVERPGIVARRFPDGRIHVRHGLRPDEIHDGLAEELAAALAPVTDSHRAFGRAFTGIVLTSDPDPMTAWTRFYRNTLAGIDRRGGYNEVYRYATDLLRYETVLDLGCSFGFLAMHLRQRGIAVTACDIDPGTTRLVRTVAAALDLDIDICTSDAVAVPLPTGSVDAVALLHVLEHVDPDTGTALLDEALRVARHRVVVAVPYETTPNALFGHVRAITESDLLALGIRSGWQCVASHNNGGWLVLDRRVTARKNAVTE